MKAEAEWLEIFTECESSGLPQKDYCKQKGVSYWKFCQQRSDLVKRGLLKAMRSQPFLPIQIVEMPQVKLPVMIEIQLPHGIILRIPPDVAV